MSDDKVPGYAAWFPREIAKYDSERLFRDAEAIGSLVDHPGWQVIQRMGAEKLDKQVQKTRHNALAHLDYVWNNGIASGVEQVLCLPGAVLEAAQRMSRTLEEKINA